MQRIILFMLSALTTSMSLSQNTAAISQNSVNDLASILQVSGTGNSAEVFQNGMSAAVTTAQIEQIGSDNTAGIHQVFNTLGGKAVTHQVGNGHTASQSETDVNSNALILQSGRGGGYGEANIAEQVLGPGMNGKSAAATIVQQGNSNEARQHLLSLGNAMSFTYAYQNGNENIAEQEQTGGGNDYAVNWQIGNSNHSALVQSGSSSAWFVSLGDNNVIAGTNGDLHATQAGSSSAVAAQYGNSNRVELSQANASTAAIQQVGNANHATVDQR